MTNLCHAGKFMEVLIVNTCFVFCLVISNASLCLPPQKRSKISFLAKYAVFGFAVIIASVNRLFILWLYFIDLKCYSLKEDTQCVRQLVSVYLYSLNQKSQSRITVNSIHMKASSRGGVVTQRRLLVCMCFVICNHRAPPHPTRRWRRPADLHPSSERSLPGTAVRKPGQMSSHHHCQDSWDGLHVHDRGQSLIFSAGKLSIAIKTEYRILLYAVVWWFLNLYQ